MKSKLLFICFLLLSCFIISCKSISKPPLPATLNIASPAQDIPLELAAFLGVWEGKWGAVQDTIVVIEKINKDEAEIILSFGNLVDGAGFKPPNYYRYIKANVVPGPVLEFNEVTEPNPSAVEKGDYVCPCKATFELDKDLNMLIVYWEYSNYNSKLRADLTRRK